MNTFQDYESMGRLNFNGQTPPILESYSGTQIVQWSGNIERQLHGMLVDQEKSKNWPYTDKLRKFLEIWRANEITGSINREVLDVIRSASDILAVDNWNLANYFSNLRDQLRILIASEEQLPRGVDMNQNDPMAGGGGGRSSPPLSPSFGPEDTEPGAGGPDVPLPPGGGAEGKGGTDLPPGDVDTDLPPPDGGEDDDERQDGVSATPPFAQ